MSPPPFIHSVFDLLGGFLFVYYYKECCYKIHSYILFMENFSLRLCFPSRHGASKKMVFVLHIGVSCRGFGGISIGTGEKRTIFMFHNYVKNVIFLILHNYVRKKYNTSI